MLGAFREITAGDNHRPIAPVNGLSSYRIADGMARDFARETLCLHCIPFVALLCHQIDAKVMSTSAIRGARS